MLKLLSEEKRYTLITYCKERFGLSKEIFENIELCQGSKKKIYMLQKIANLRLNPESSGLCIFRFDKSPKPTTNFLQLFGSKINKNVVDIDRENLIKFCRGDDLIINLNVNSVKPGFIAIRFNELVIGCAHWNKDIIKNQIPKSRRCKINYL